MALIHDTIAPTKWVDVGGPYSMAQLETNHTIVVSATGKVHDEIAELLGQFERIDKPARDEILSGKPTVGWSI